MNRHTPIATAIAALAAPTLLAQTQHPTPNVIDRTGPISSSLHATQFVNRGLVGVGRVPAFIDAQGSTFGSVSSLAAVPGSWSYDPASKRYTGRFLTIPDRGRNDPGTSNFINYQGRIQKFDVSFAPLNEGGGASQDQLRLTYAGLIPLKEASGAPLVGIDPGPSVGTAFDRPVPRVNGKIALDAEGLIALPSGEYYVSDEYGPAIYRFDAGGVLRGVISPPPALMPRDAKGDLNFTSVAPPATGRRNNQGIEGLSVSPDGKLLFAMNQSGALQDCAGADQKNRRFTRVLVYDISKDPTPASPVGHYVMELPTYRASGDGGAADRTATQSEILALSNTQFLVLARDSNGRGSGAGLPPVYKSVLLADLAGATNLVGTPFEGTTPLTANGALVSGITPVSQTQALNMLNTVDLGRFGLNLAQDAQHKDGDANTLSEKWEGLCLLPDLATPDPTDYFLFIANDNDFLTTDCVMVTSDGTTIAHPGGINNDTFFLVYRVNIAQAGGSLPARIPAADPAGILITPQGPQNTAR